MSITKTLNYSFREVTKNIPVHLAGGVTRLHSACFFVTKPDDQNLYIWLESEASWNGRFNLKLARLETSDQRTDNMEITWLRLNMGRTQATIETINSNLSAIDAMVEITQWEAQQRTVKCHGEVKLFSRRPEGNTKITGAQHATALAVDTGQYTNTLHIPEKF